MAKGIRALPVVRDHPNWWFVLSLDGYGSHLNVYKTLKLFADHKIWLVKEEGDTSHVNQAYDQAVAKADKTEIRRLLDRVRHSVGVITQWQSIAICIKALEKVQPESWIGLKSTCTRIFVSSLRCS